MDAWRRLHRILAAIFLLTLPSAAYFSLTGADPANPHPLVYAPLFPMVLMIVTGTWMLVRPWLGNARSTRKGV